MAKFSPIRTGDEQLDRVQDAAAKALRGALQVPDAPARVVGSRGGNAALASLLTALARLGLIVDETT